MSHLVVCIGRRVRRRTDRFRECHDPIKREYKIRLQSLERRHLVVGEMMGASTDEPFSGIVPEVYDKN